MIDLRQNQNEQPSTAKCKGKKKKTNERMVPVGKPGRHRSRDDANGTYLMSIFFC